MNYAKKTIRNELILDNNLQGGVLMFYAQLLSHKRLLEQQLNDIQKQLETLPEGDIHYSLNGKYIKWYQSHFPRGIYIKKKDTDLAVQLALRKYYQRKLSEIQNELHFVKAYLNALPSAQNNLESSSDYLLSEASPYHNLLIPYFENTRINDTRHKVQDNTLHKTQPLLSMPLSKEAIIAWKNAPFNANPNFHEELTHKTLLGYNVRSKSEEHIANELFLSGIPLRYEAELTLTISSQESSDYLYHSPSNPNKYAKTYYPDFTILNPKTGQVFYWEHFGMMDNQKYREKTIQKLQVYFNNNILPGINLITTYETKENPLTLAKVKQVINDYF